MRKTMVLAAVAAAVMVAAGASAQESQEPQEGVTQEEARPEPARKIRVLEDPYDISSFYRSRQSNRGLFGYEESQPSGNAYENPYAIAGYYRSRQQRSAYGYSAFWAGGYGDRGMRRGFGRRIGTHGDLFLIAPTILAPIGPLSGSLLVE